MIPTKWSKKFSLFFKSLHEKRRMLRLRRIVLVRQPKTISESGTLLLLLQRTLRLSLRRPPLLRRQRRRRRPRCRRQLSSKNGHRRTNRLILPSDFFGNRLRAGMKMSSTDDGSRRLDDNDDVDDVDDVNNVDDVDAYDDSSSSETAEKNFHFRCKNIHSAKWVSVGLILTRLCRCR